MFGSKNFDRYFFRIGFVILCGVFGFAIGKVVRRKHEYIQVLTTYNVKRITLKKVYTSQIGMQEATGSNDGPEIEKYLKFIGLRKGYSYCAAFACWSMAQAGIANPKNGWAPALFPAKRVIWTRTGGGSTPQNGDVFGLYFTELKRIAHCGFVDQWDKVWCITVEANTNDIGSVMAVEDPGNPIRAGPSKEGVYRKKRLIKTIFKVANWIDPL